MILYSPSPSRFQKYFLLQILGSERYSSYFSHFPQSLQTHLLQKLHSIQLQCYKTFLFCSPFSLSLISFVKTVSFSATRILGPAATVTVAFATRLVFTSIFPTVYYKCAQIHIKICDIPKSLRYFSMYQNIFVNFKRQQDSQKIYFLKNMIFFKPLQLLILCYISSSRFKTHKALSTMCVH